MRLDSLKVTQYVLSKQHLLEGHEATDVLEATRDIIGLHATDNVTPYLSLFARVRGFEKEHLDLELYQNRSMGRVECMRSTLFLVPKETVPIVYQIYKGGLPQGLLKNWEMSIKEYEEISHLVLEALKNKTLTAIQIKKQVPDNIKRLLVRRVGKNIVRVTNVGIVLLCMLRQGTLLSMKQPGVLKAGGPSYYARFDYWFPDVNLDETPREEALIRLVELYIQAYGPVTARDISWWSGFRMSTTRELLELVRYELMECEIYGLDSEFVMSRADFSRFEHFKPIKGHSVSFLPYEDSYIKGYKERERLIPREMHDSVYVYGEAMPSILIDGQIAGTWRLETQREPMLAFHLFEKIGKSLLRRVRLEADAVGRFVSASKIKIKEI